MSRDRNRPSDVILDLLRGAPGAGRSASYLIDSGKLFGFSDNIIRVNLSRLQRRGLIESPARGQYRLAPTADPLNTFVERWRLGEDRVRPWTPHCWLLMSDRHSTEPHTASAWALDALGFRRIAPNLQVRPDNLALGLDELKQLAASIGVPKDMILLCSTTRDDKDWPSLWDSKSIDRDYASMIRRLEDSRSALADMSLEDARLETFKLGGAAIHLLAKDPLLPDSFVDTRARLTLWQVLLDYDTAGKRIWANSRKERDGGLPVPRLPNVMQESA